MLPAVGVPPISAGADIGALQQKMLKQRQLALQRSDLARKVPHVAAAQHDLPVLAERTLQMAPSWRSLLLEAEPLQPKIEERSCVAVERTSVDSNVPTRCKVAGTPEPLVWCSSEVLAAKALGHRADSRASADAEAESEQARLGNTVHAVHICDVDSDSGPGSIPLSSGVVELGTSPAPSTLERPKRAGGLGGLGLAGPSSRKDGPTGGWDLEIRNEEIKPEDATAKQGSKSGRRLWRPWRSSSNRQRTVQIVVEEADQVASFSGAAGMVLENESDSGELRRTAFAGVADGRAATPWPESVAELLGTLDDESNALPRIMNCDD